MNIFQIKHGHLANIFAPFQLFQPWSILGIAKKCTVSEIWNHLNANILPMPRHSASGETKRMEVFSNASPCSWPTKKLKTMKEDMKHNIPKPNQIIFITTALANSSAKQATHPYWAFMCRLCLCLRFRPSLSLRCASKSTSRHSSPGKVSTTQGSGPANRNS